MAKQEVGRAAKSDVSQKDAAELLKKKVQEQAAEAAAADVSAEASAEVAAVAATAVAADAPAAEMAAAAPEAMFAQASTGGVLGTGLSTGAAVGIGLAVVGGGLLIAEASDDDDEGGGSTTSPISAKATSNGVTEITQIAEGATIVYVIEGKPGQVFNYAFVGTGITPNDYVVVSPQPVGAVTIDSNGKALLTVQIVDDLIPEGNETLTLIGVGDDTGVSVPVTIIDGALAENYVLTTGIDNFPTPQGGPIGIVEGIVDTASGTRTYSPGDTLIGNDVGTSVLELNVIGNVATSTAIAVEVEGFAAIELNAGVTGTVFFNAARWEDVGQVELVDGVNGMFVGIGLGGQVGAAEAGVDLIINQGITGGILASYTNGLIAGIGNGSDGGASVIHDANGVPDFTVDASGGPGAANAGFMFAFSTGSNDIVVGDMTGVADTSDTLVAAVTGSQDVTVGDISLTLGDTGFITVGFVAGTASTGNNLTVGDITVQGGDNVSVSISALMSSSQLDMTIGNVSAIVGDATGGATTAFIFAGFFNSSALGGADLTVGDVTLAVGESGAMSFSVFLSGIGGTTQTSSLGNLTVGDVNVTLGEDASMFSAFSIFQFQGGVTNTGVGMGDFTVGDLSFTLGQDASVTFAFLGQTLTGVSAGPMGDFTVGNIDLDLAIGAFLSMTVFAANTATSASGTAMHLGNFSVGDIGLTLNDGATAAVAITALATSGDIPSFSIGDVAMDLNVGAVGVVVASALANNVDVASFGDISVLAGQSATGVVVYSVGASSGDIGALSIGNVALSATESGAATAVFVAGATDDISSISIGDVSLVAGHDGAVAVAVLSASAGGEIGVVNIGDVNLELKNSNTAVGGAVAIFGIAAGVEIEEINIGDIRLASTTNSTGALIFSLSQSAPFAGHADINIGQLTLSATSATVNPFVFVLTGTNGVTSGIAGDVTIGNIDVNVIAATPAGTSGVFDLTVLLGAVSVTTTGNTGNLFLGTIDYADYNVTAGVVATRAHGGTIFDGAVIDGSGFNGDLEIIGSVLDDLIYDNIHSNTLTGGDGADKFFISGGNTGKQATNLDVITDFEHNVDTIIIGTATGASASSISAPTINQYSEASYASFAAFLAGANALAAGATPDFLHAGQVGSDTFVAVDSDQDGVVEFVIQLVGVSTGTLDFGDFAFNL